MNDKERKLIATSIQYGLGVAIGNLVIQARKDGASDDELIATLRNTIRILEDNKAIRRGAHTGRCDRAAPADQLT